MTRVRRDVAALQQMRALRAAGVLTRVVTNAVYVSGDDEYEIWRVTRNEVVLRCRRNHKAFIIAGHSYALDPSRWRYR